MSENLSVPIITILEYELIINKKLLENSVITKKQYDEVCNIIFKKISSISKKVAS